MGPYQGGGSVVLQFVGSLNLKNGELLKKLWWDSGSAFAIVRIDKG
jgi:hypothetical protein